MAFFTPKRPHNPGNRWIWLLTEAREIQHAIRNESDPKEIVLLHQLEEYVFADLQDYIDHFYDTPVGLIRYDLLDKEAKAKLQATLDRLKRHEID
jgi:hypothetical protein